MSQSLEEFDDDFDDNPIRECDESCSHYDSLNQCCWQAGDWGLCFDVEEGDYCHLGYKEEES